ncbi:MAG: phage tail tube protein [Pseudomonadota bacterium]
MLISGEKFLLKIGDGANPENFTVIGGIIASDLTISNNVIGNDTINSGKWQRLLTDSGIAAVNISGNGFFTDSAAEDLLISQVFSRSISNYQLEFGNGKILVGGFIISEYKKQGNIDDLVTFSMNLVSSGAVTYS